MDYNYIFHSAKLRKDSLLTVGFHTKDGNEYKMSLPVSNGAFNAEVTLLLSDQSINVHLFDAATGEKYIIFDMPSGGAFVASLRKEVQNIINDIKSRCFETNDLKDDFVTWIKSQFGAEPDFPWPDDSPDYFVFRCPNEKWFALVMKIKYRQLGLTGDEDVWVVNMKADQENIPDLSDKKSIFPAWKKNKKHWITVLLTAATDFERLCELTKKSFELVYPS